MTALAEFVPSSDPAEDEIGGITETGWRLGDSVRQAAPPPTAASLLASLSDESDDDLSSPLLPTRRPRRAAARTTPYTFRPSIVKPADPQADARHGVPRPLVESMPRRDTRFSIEALLKDKRSQSRSRSQTPMHFEDYTVSAHGVDPDTRAAMQRVLPDDAATQDALLRILARDAEAGPPANVHTYTSAYWVRDVPRCTREDVEKLHHVCACVHQGDTQSLSFADWINVAVNGDHEAAYEARRALGDMKAWSTVLDAIPMLLAQLGAAQVLHEPPLVSCFVAPRDQCVHRVWQLARHAIQAKAGDPLVYIPPLLQLGAAPPLCDLPYERDTVLTLAFNTCTDFYALVPRIVHICTALAPLSRTDVLHAIPLTHAGRVVRARVAFQLLVPSSTSSDVDIPLLTSLLSDVPGAPLCTTLSPTDTRDYILMRAHAQLLSFALSDVSAILHAQGANALHALRSLVQQVWKLCRSIHGQRSAHIDQMAAKDVVQRLGWRLSYQARSYVEGCEAAHAPSLQPLLDGLLAQAE